MRACLNAMVVRAGRDVGDESRVSSSSSSSSSPAQSSLCANSSSTSSTPSPLDAISDTLTRILADERALTALPGERFAFEKKLRAARFRAERARTTVGAHSTAGDAARARFDARRAVESIAFWRALAEDESAPTRALFMLLRLALSGRDEPRSGARVLSARALAAAYRPADADPDALLTDVALFRCADALVAWQSAANFGSGFVAGLGGMLTLPITIPAQLIANAFVALRLSFALAILAGKDPLDPSVAARAITAAIGGVVDEVDIEDVVDGGADEPDIEDAVAAAATHAAAVGVSRGVHHEYVQYAASRAQGAALQGSSWRLTRLAATAFAERGASRSATMAASRAIPLIGGLIGGTVDGLMTNNAGRRAMDAFFPPRPSSASCSGVFDIKERLERSKNEALARAKDVGDALNGAFDKMKVSFNARMGNTTQSNAAYDVSEGGYQSRGVEDDSWERWERERELEAMRAILEDDAMDYDGDATKTSDTFGTSSSTKRRDDADVGHGVKDESTSTSSQRQKEILWLEHHAAWKVFIEDFADTNAREMRYKDIPFPPTTSRILLGAAGGKRATAEDVKAAYRRLMLMYHPDRFSKFTVASDDREKVFAKLGALSSQIKDQWLAYEAQRAKKAAKKQAVM